MTVLAVDPRRGLALCAGAGGERQSVETALVDPVAPGDRLLVHAGTAIAAVAGGAVAVPPVAGSAVALSAMVPGDGEAR